MDSVLCYLCFGTVSEKKMKPSSSDPALRVQNAMIRSQHLARTNKHCMPIVIINDIQNLQLTKVLCNWNDTAAFFRRHETSQCHKEAFEKML